MGNTPAERAAFSWEHAMAHRASYGAMPDLSQFSLLPYHLDPLRLDSSKYLLDHQQAHNDANTHLPTFPYSVWAGRPPVPQEPTPTPIGIPATNNLIDTTGSMRWWTFANHMEHYLMQASLPQTLGPFPFW
jgi:hypothetical protein